jgi:hypothetical protein
LPPDGRGGFVLNGTAFGSYDPLCLWLDGAGAVRLANNVGVDRRRAADCPSGAILAHADGSAIGVRQFGDGVEGAEGDKLDYGEQDVIALDPNGRRLWRIARPKSSGHVGAMLFGLDATLWLIGTVDAAEGKPTTVFVDRYSWR